MSILDGIIRATALISSGVLFYLAACVYENEEKRLQNRIEGWWAQFDDLRSQMISRSAALFAISAEKTLIGLNMLLPGSDKRIVAYGRSLLACGSSFFIFLAIFWYCGERGWIPKFTGPRSDFDSTSDIVFWLFGLVFLAVWIMAGLAFERRYVRGLFWTVIGFSSLFIADGLVGLAQEGANSLNPASPENRAELVSFLLGLPVALKSTLWISSCLRRALTSAATGHKGLRLTKNFVLPTVWVVALVLLSIVAPAPHKATNYVGYDIFISVFLVLLCNTFILWVVTLLAFSVFLVMLLHNATWPILSRLLYNVPRHDILKQKKTLFATSATLFLIGVTGIYSWSDLRHLVLGT
ncbi:hypothetical protein F6X40_10330 [Paraburkholderia sp. UCT31]|uniref:hypothetical protein n=1 Tax=Paraburkholderia sp. UCT31 TaxID=2615209 RepID=UPI0016566B73|nr:hypothetical protein [Paraburkholderia sp. UCT31]MBC8737204.1 hypothetical protein [Paraburkholderia sp. UCT31]